jgi:hypothetical protein
VSRSKDIGTRAETGVVRFLRTAGWPHAERRALAGVHDLGDVTGTPGIVWEVKARKKPPGDGEIAAWMDETEAERNNADAEIGILVVRRPGYGQERAGHWWAYLRLDALIAGNDSIIGSPRWYAARGVPVRLTLSHAAAYLHAAGYGTPGGAS